MRELTTKEYSTLTWLRAEKYRNYFYGLAKTMDGKHATVSAYKSQLWTIQEIPTINEDIPLKQDKLDFVNDHAAIHISPKKHIWRWIDND